MNIFKKIAETLNMLKVGVGSFFKKHTAFVFIIIFALIGATQIPNLFAAPSSITNEAENNASTINTTNVSDSTASNESAIVFGRVPNTVSLKDYPKGLVLTDPTTINLYSYINFVTIKSVGWADIEVSPGVFDWSPIDNVIASTKAKNPNTKFRIRLYSGKQAPAWLNNISGSCINITPDSANGGAGCVPRFWTKAYIDRYALFIDAFSAKYESDSSVVDVINSACSTIFAESFILGSDAASDDLLWQAGLTEAGHRECLNRTTEKIIQAFPTTRVTIAGHSKWQIVSQGPNGAGDAIRSNSWEKERDLLNQWRAKYGEQLIIEEHGLGPTDYCAPGESILSASSFYCWFASLSAPKGLQFTLNGGSMVDAANNGLNMNACFLEFAAFMAIPATDRQKLHNDLIANCS
jgi:hypothetical protein